jgi:hypothetical protein
MRRMLARPHRAYPLMLLAAALLPASGEAKERIVTFPDVPSASAIAVGDLDGDGHADLALVEAAPNRTSPGPPPFHLHLFFQKNGRFASPADRIIPLGPAGPSGLAIGDFDGDGLNDVAVGLRPDRSLVLYLGAERFEKEHRSRYGNDSGAGGLSAGRLNSQGLADFLTGAAWRQWRGENRFGEAFFAGPERNDHWRSTLADMDRDGVADVIFTTYWAGQLNPPSNNRIRICYGPFLKMAIIQPTEAAQVVTLNSPFTASDKPLLGPVLVGDVNDDDQNDLLVAAAGKTLVYLQNSPTGFSENAPPTLIINDLTPLLVHDLNGDKLCDAAFLPANRAGISVWHQRKGTPLTAERFVESPLIAIPKMTGVIASGDLDGDGSLEIFAAQTGGGLAILFLERP